VEHAGDHFAGDIVVEFFDLFSNVVQKGVAGPATNHHDEKHRTTTKEHAIAAPEQMECVLIALAAMWRMSSPIDKTASCSAFLICLEVMCLMWLDCQMAEIGVSLLAPG
jgi:hypothetical protein